MFWGEKAGMTPLRTLFHPAEAVGPDRMLWCPMSLSICAPNHASSMIRTSLMAAAGCTSGGLSQQWRRIESRCIWNAVLCLIPQDLSKNPKCPGAFFASSRKHASCTAWK